MFVELGLTLLLKSVVTNDWVNNGDSCQVVVLCIVLVDELIGDVWHIEAAIALASDVDFLVLQSKGTSELLVEASKLLGELHFIGDVWDTLGVANSDGLLNPNHVCQVRP